MLRNILNHPLFGILFGNDGIMEVIVTIIPFLKKRRKVSNKYTQQESRQSSLHPNNSAPLNTKPIATNSIKPVVPNNIQFRHNNVSNISTKDKEMASFIAELRYTSPVNDKITLTKIDFKKK